MIDKERIGDENAPVEEMNAAQVERLRALLGEAYPGPTRNVRPAVEAAIRRERADARRARFVRWGGLAACLAVIALIGVFALPRTLVKLAPVAEKADECALDPAEAPAEMANVYTAALVPDADEAPEEEGEPEAPATEAAGSSRVMMGFAPAAPASNANNAVPEANESYELCSNDLIAECEAEEDAVVVKSDAVSAKAAFLAEFTKNLLARIGDNGDSSPDSVSALIASNSAVLSADAVETAWAETAAWFKSAYPGSDLPDYAETTGMGN